MSKTRACFHLGSMLVFNHMKNALRVAFIQVLSFIVVFTLGTTAFLVRSVAVNSVAYPQAPFSVFGAIIDIIPLSAFVSVFISAAIALIYGLRKGYHRLAILPILLLLSLSLSFSGVFLTRSLANSILAVPESNDMAASPMERNGLILRTENGSQVIIWPRSVVNILDDDKLGSLALSTMPTSEIFEVYESPFEAAFRIPEFFLIFYKNITLLVDDLNLSLDNGVLVLLAYCAALVAVVLAFHPVADLTCWPLANAIFCAVLYPLLLTGVTLLTSGPIQRTVLSWPFIFPQYAKAMTLGVVALALWLLGFFFALIRAKGPSHA